MTLRRRAYTSLTWIFALLFTVSVNVAGAVPPTEPCPEEAQNSTSPDNLLLDKYSYLRALSLDIRGVTPTPSEYEGLAASEDVPLSLIDEWLDTADFGEQIARLHRSVLWNRVRASRLIHRNAKLILNWGSQISSPGLFILSRTELLRGGPTVCLDKPAEFDPDTGAPIYEWDSGTGSWREGWVEVAPYWAPDTTVKVCAGDAQTALFTPDGVSCKSRAGMARAECGCGPNLNWCATNEEAALIRESLGHALDVRIEQLIADKAPYTDLFTTNVSYFNGPMIHYWRHLYQRYNDLVVEPTPVPDYMLPENVPFSAADTWIPIQLGSQHAGVLTSPTYLLRHTSDRRRARRFIEGLLCEPMILPEGVSLQAEGVPDPDVSKQPGCKYCHAILEPVARHWGRWSEFGAAYLSPETHPPCRSDCEECGKFGGCSTDCRANYVIQGQLTKELLYMGWLTPYKYVVDPELIYEVKAIELETKVPCDPTLVNAAMEPSVETGPILLVQQAIFDGRLAKCTARHVLTWLMGREPLEEESAWTETLGGIFQASNFDLATLVKAIVTDERYRRVR